MTQLRYHSGIKYIVAEQWEWKLVGEFHPTRPFTGKWYELQERSDGWYLIAKQGCGWDGATWFPDYKWIMQASLAHDILHWLIARGIIPEEENALIDDEMIEVLNARAQRPAFINLRSWYIRKAIGFVNQKRGPVHPVLVA